MPFGVELIIILYCTRLKLCEKRSMLPILVCACQLLNGIPWHWNSSNKQTSGQQVATVLHSVFCAL